jgi:serine/threonine-protein kinase RsbT
MTPPPASPCAVETSYCVRCDSDVAVVQAGALRLAREAGFDKKGGWEFAIAASEAATNILKHATEGEILLRACGDCLELQALDRGPGIENVEAMLRDGYSENRDLAADDIIARRRGLGLGLGAIRRLTDELSIDPRAGGGTALVARKYKNGLRR